jgi:DNA-directed RNA polymerase specialized sigma24 family protein
MVADERPRYRNRLGIRTCISSLAIPCEARTTAFKRIDLFASSATTFESTGCSNDHLHSAIRALPTKQQHLIEQLFWEERTETELANTMNINQSTINRRKQAILNGLRMKLRDHNEFQRISA